MTQQDDFDSRGIGFTRPKDLGGALSMIQNWHAVEAAGGEFPDNFFSWDHFTAFFQCGVSSAVKDSFLWAVIYVLGGGVAYFIQENFLVDRTTQVLFWDVKGHPLYLITELFSFGFLVYHTGLAVQVTQLSTGVVCRKAAHTIASSRSGFLFSFAVGLFFVIGLIYKGLDDQTMYTIASYVATFSQTLGERVYLFLKYFFKNYLFQASLICFLTAMISTVITYLPIVFKRFRKTPSSRLGPGGR